MKSRQSTWLFVLLLCMAGGLFLVHRNHVLKVKTSSITQFAPGSLSSANHSVSTNVVKAATASTVTNKFAWRLSNTTRPLKELMHDPHAILLENAFIDTGAKINLSIPKNLQAHGDPGAYIIQASGPTTPAFRSILAAAGATIVSYIPNDAYLVRATEAVANGLAGNPLVQVVIPYEPYYKVQSSLLSMAQQQLPANVQLNLGLFPGDASATLQQIEQLGGIPLHEEHSAAGYSIVEVEPPANWTSIAALPGVHIVEPIFRRAIANDLARPMLGVAADSLVTSNYFNLTGSNVMVQVNDTGIDIKHPDFSNNHTALRVFFSDPVEGTDTNGHGTHVAGIIAGDGTESTTVTNASGSFMPGTNGQFRGKAPLATMFAMNYLDDDQTLQEAAATNKALISNNSWNFEDDQDYDLGAASYDAATRDALPFTTGPQPVLFVFSAGNDGNGGIPGTVDSPATAKNIITVGALEELRDITNSVTNAAGTMSEPWQGETDDPSAVPGFSSCGNVGIGTEGTFGRFKPDVVAPGTFVVSCRSSEWDTNSYYNPTNNNIGIFPDLVPADSTSIAPFDFFVPSNAVNIIFATVTNALSPNPLPPLLIYTSPGGGPFQLVGISPGPLSFSPSSALNSDWSVEVSNFTSTAINYDLIVDVQTTNPAGNYEQVLQGLNDNLGTQPEYYRYETGTSMAAAAISGFLALIQDYFTNQLGLLPSPALLKAMTINGARVTAGYNFQVNNSINFEGWGLPDLSNSVPVALTNLPVAGNVNAQGPACSTYFREENPTNALATGDSETFMVSINTNDFGNYVPLRVTLAWTDPPGDPSAAIKLVNSLELVVTDLDNPNNIYYGNDIGSGQIYNTAEGTNVPPVIDNINNVQNVFIPPLLDGNYSITIIGNEVNANAVPEQTNNDVQDYALVISSGDMGEIPDALQVTDDGIVSNPTGDQNISIGVTNQILLNQTAGGNTPLLGTNTVLITTNSQFTIGMTNQWHFYIVTNTTTFTNAAFITFGTVTLALPRMGVFATSDANATTPGADLDMLVTASGTDPNASQLTNLSPVEVSNCVLGASGDGSSLVSGGTDFVAYTNSQPQEIYYVGIKSENQQAVQYGFIPIFTQTPFGGTDTNGNGYLNALNVPQLIPDGTPSHPGISRVFYLDLNQIEIQNTVITNIILNQNFGSLVGSITHNGTSVVLNNHDSLTNAPGPYTLIYDDSGQGDIKGSRSSDGPGSLRKYNGTSGEGVWQLTEEGTTLAQTGLVENSQIFLEKHQNLQNGIDVVLQPGQWYYNYVVVPNGITNLQIFGTNITPVASLSPQPIQMYLLEGAEPTATDFDFMALLNNGTPPGNEISDGPPLAPDVYYVGLFNPNAIGTFAQEIYLLAVLNGPSATPQPTYFSATNTTPLVIDAVTNTTVFVSNSNVISSVNVGMVVQYPRISDLAFTLVSPTGQRILLMQNRGGLTATNAGGVFYVTNSIGTVNASGSFAATTNSYNLGVNNGTVAITYNTYIVPDQMTVYYGNDPTTFNNTSGDLLFNSGMIGTGGPVTTNISFGPGASTYITIIMNQFGNPNMTNSASDSWTYTLNGTLPDFNYLTFTDDTNLTQVPIKFAIPPFDLSDFGTNYIFGDFDFATNGDYFGQTNIYDPFGGWNVPSNLVAQVITNTLETNNCNEVSVISDPSVAFLNNTNSSNYLALGYGIIQRTNFISPNRMISVSYDYRGPGISGWWRGEGNANDSSDAEQQGQNGSLIGRFDFPVGQVGQSFEMENNGSTYDFAGTNSYVQIRQQPMYVQENTNSSNPEATPVTVQASYLDVGTGPGLTVEGWINPTNIEFQQPLVEWLARVPTNGSDTNLFIRAGPYLDTATQHYYYLLAATNWTTSETWAEELGGHLATVDTADEQNWIFNTFGGIVGRSHTLWIGLTNNPVLHTFAYSSGLTNVYYTNWFTTQPNNPDNTWNYTLMFGNTNAYPGLWALADNNGTVFPAVSNIVYGVVEVTNLQTNGVQFWISITNVPGSTNLLTTNTGCLFANLIDTTNGSHWICSPPGLIQTNVFQHVALTYDTNSGLANLYYDGTNVATTNIGVIIPKTTGDVLLGRDMNVETNNYYGGLMDEMSIYSRALSDAEIGAIYQVSAYTTNRLVGKFDPAITPPESLAEAQVIIGATTNIILGENNTWQQGSVAFTSQGSTLPIQVTGIEPGMLFDSFFLSEAPLGNLYYQPEQSLDELNGESAYGDWTLEIWNTRNNTLATNVEIVSWQLQMVLQTNTLPQVAVQSQTPTTITVNPGQIVELAITPPTWATEATNILVSSTLPLNVFLNTNTPPTATVPPDTSLFAGMTGSATLNAFPAAPQIPGTPDFVPGQTYYIGLQNTGTSAASAVFAVDYDVTALTNGVPYTDTNTLSTNGTFRYFSYTVSSNAYEATFQLLDLSGNADLVVSKGTPLPTLTSSDYGSFNSGRAPENIYVFTNSTPVPLSQGTWYIGVFNRASNAVNYTVLAKELDLPLASIGGLPSTNMTLIPLTNSVPFDYTAGPGAALTNFFYFVVTNPVVNGVTNYVGAVHFQLYNLSGNGDLTVQTNAPPFGPPFFQSSDEPGTLPEYIQIRTNSALTNLAATYYLGVPNLTTNLINFTILAVIDTNAYFPAFPGAEGEGGGALGGRGGNVYHVINLNDSGYGSMRYGITNFFGTGATNTPGTGTTNLPDGDITNVSGALTIVFDVAGIIHLQSPLIITNSYITIAGQTAPNGGITVGGQMTAVQSAHDVVIRDVRFRRGSADDSLQVTNVMEAIADHVSAEWTSDNLMSVLDSSNITVQWSMLSDSLYIPTNNPPPMGSLLRYGSGALSFHHNVYADNYTGSPRLGDNISLDFVNNVIYDWGTNAGFSTNDSAANPNGFTNYLNYVCNYIIASTDTLMTNIAFWSGTTNTWIFQTNNFIDSDHNGVLNGANTGWKMFTNWPSFIGQYTPTNQFPLLPVSTDPAYLAYEKDLDFAGVDMYQRDPVDSNIVEHVRKQTGAFISLPPLAGLVDWWKGEGNALDSWYTNNGIWTNGPTYTNGEVGQAFYFGGNARQQFIDIPYSKSLIYPTYTVETWIDPMIEPTNSENQDWVFGQNSGLQLNIRQGTPGVTVDFQFRSGAPFYTLVSTNQIPLNTFTHVAGTWDGTTLRLYINGVPNATLVPGTTPVDSGNDFDIGGVANDQYFGGIIDEVSYYKRALTTNEIASIYNEGHGGKFSWYTKFLEPDFVNSDRDGIPDFWKTTFGESLTNTDNNLLSTNANDIGYSDLEEFDNWLAGPHAVTVTNTPVGVNLQQLFGYTGNLSFFLTNAINGTVYLTNVLGSYTNTSTFSNSIAIFTPAVYGGTNYSGYALFGVYVTNNDTMAYFGPVTVSVVVSAVPVTYTAMAGFLPPGEVASNSIPANTIEWYQINVPTNALAATNSLLFAGEPMNLWFSTNLPPSTGNPTDFELLSGSTNGSAIININGTPLPPVLVPGGTYYLGVQNTNNVATNYSVEVNFETPSIPGVTALPGDLLVTNIVVGSSAVYYAVLVPPNAIAATNILLYATNGSPINLWFNQTTLPTFATPPDTEMLTGFSGTTPGIGNPILTTNSTPPLVPGQFYYLAVDNRFNITQVNYAIEVNFDLFYSSPLLPAITNQIVDAGNTLIVTNTATDTNAGTLFYTLTTAPPVGATINGNGIITWQVPTNEPGTNILFTTVVTNSFTDLTATNSFTVTVIPLLTGNSPQTNSVASNSVSWLTVDVPRDAEWATNILLYATNLPVNMLFTTNSPPVTNNAAVLLANSTGGSSVLGIQTTPTNITSGGVYYLGIQNNNALSVGYAVQVDFGLYPPPVLPTISNQVLTAGNTLVVTNTATNSAAVGTLVYSLATSPQVNATISTNGIITWVTTTNLAATNIVFTTIVTNSFTALSATNYFTVFLEAYKPQPRIVLHIVHTSIGGTNGYLLTWYAPTNDIFQVQEAGSAASPVTWNAFTNIITYTGPSTPTNGLFSFFDNGTQYPFGPLRLYRLLLLGQSDTLALASLPNYVVAVSQLLSVTNAATDSNPLAVVNYTLADSPAPNVSPVIGSSSGIITFMPQPADAGSEFKFTTTVTDNGAPPASAQDAFTVFVLPAPPLATTAVTSTNVTFHWDASTNDLFQVEWATNLSQPVWTLFPQTVSSTTGLFTFSATNRVSAEMFYRLVWEPLP